MVFGHTPPGWPFTWMLECTLIDTRSTLQLGCWQLCQLELCLNVPHCFLFAFSKCLESFLIADIHIHERNIGIVYTPLWRKNKETFMSINCEKIRWQIGNKKLRWPSSSDHNGGWAVGTNLEISRQLFPPPRLLAPAWFWFRQSTRKITRKQVIKLNVVKKPQINLALLVCSWTCISNNLSFFASFNWLL